MAVRIRDTLPRETVELTTREPGKLSMYVCGPTVYDVPHIGNARTAVVFDIVWRYLEWTGLDVTFVSNVTDVDDKIIDRAAERGHTEPELARRVEAAYFDEDRARRAATPTVPHATEYIERMIELIAELVDRGHAYAVEGQGVYFDVETFPGYGELLAPHDRRAARVGGARVEVDEAKRSPMDFALWKAAKPGEPAWDSPWGRAGPAGTSSARRCRSTSSARGSTSTAAATTSCSRTTRTSGRRPKAPATGSRGTGCTPAWSRSAARRWRSRSATS